MRNSVLGVGLFVPRTIVDVLALKLRIGYQRAQLKVAKMIQINKDNMRIMNISRKWKLNYIIQSNKIQEKLSRRKLEVINRINELKQIIRNQTVIDYTKIYMIQN